MLRRQQDENGNRNGLKFRMLLIMLLIVILSAVSLGGCKSTSNQNDAQNGSEAAVEEAPKETDQQEDTDSTKAEDAALNATGDAEESKEDKFTTYIGLIGLDSESVAKALDETPVEIDEGGLAFDKEGIRVWFNDDHTVSQVFTTSSEIDLNGVRLGDDISAFKSAFGEPISDNNGDMHFQYGDVYLSVNYNVTTQKTLALYILKEDF